MTAGQAGTIADANVLIDYASVDKGILGLISRHLGPLRIASPVLEEVKQLSEPEARKLGLELVEPTLGQAIEAESARGATSFQDQLCLILARDHGWTVISNDKPLRALCAKLSIRCMWGLEAMAILVHGGHLTAAKAAGVAEAIAKQNIFITQQIVGTFRKKIGL